VIKITGLVSSLVVENRRLLKTWCIPLYAEIAQRMARDSGRSGKMRRDG